ncbi:hypothetical protein AB0F88_21670 [Streptosporangium sp. NPDC023963]|uniref:hypothetical protein n=1 Tax=Streptosporangium sp. NPDC023963 TaxID=3155608 RepID=UPI003445F5B5
MATRSVLVPDQHEDLLAMMASAEELLITFGLWEDDGDPGDLPEALVGRAALEALHSGPCHQPQGSSA